MSDELNRKFADDPESFFRKYVLNFAPIFGKEAGVYDFDLREGSDPRKTKKSLKGVFLDPVRGPAHVSAPIKAFWLPWKNTESTHAQVKNESFIFTPALSGCRFAFEDTDEFLRIAHICGAKWETPDARNARQQELGFGRDTRKYSESDLKKLPGGTGASSYQYNTFISGVRRNGRWRFFAQNTTGSQDTGFELKQLDIIDTHSGAAHKTSGVVPFITRFFS